MRNYESNSYDADLFADALLNQTDIRNNNNKFYIIQLLNSSNNYFVWTRWGRVGADGQSNLDSFSSVDDAVKSFCKKFTDKTRNRWENRDSFEKIPGKYFLLERDTGDESDDETESTVAAAPEKMAKVPDSTLPPSVQSLMNLIFNMDMMTRTMVEIGFDAKKMPLGKLSKTTIEKAYKVLARISQQIDQSNPLTLMDMSSEFYTIIPHDFGRRKPPVIDTPHALKNKLEMLQALGDIEIASQLLATTAAQCTQNPVDLHYKSLKAAISPIDAKSAEFQLVNTYLQTTHAETHGQFSLSLEDLYEVERSEETDRFKKIHNRQLLWHGSLLTNFVGILSQGLRIAPPEAPVSGYMFGKGIYFADMASKSANYCRVNRGVGILLLCEVALGHTLKLHQADYDGPVSCKKANCHSVHGKGRSAPDPSQHVKHPADPDLLVPCGKASKSADPNCALLYNEFIVYDVAQVKIR
ncbi:poly polymerase catalytic domain-containing protein [Phlyctochytrium arcticum]|nr:poly polymerase catalytic domain-containing protein [Phlyctochytrium arcticum]